MRYRLRLERPELATGGPYAYVRNPVYDGNTFLLCGLAVVCGNAWLLPLILFWCALVYSLAVRFEELRLHREFGRAYEEYCERVPRWLPRVERHQPEPSGMASMLAAAGAELPSIALAWMVVVREAIVHGC